MSPGKVSTLDFEKFYNIVDGKQRGSDKIHRGINPSTGQELWDVPIASEQDLNDAVAAAKKAFPAWRDTPIEKRKELIGKVAESFQAHHDEFVSLLCKESGKPRKFAAIEVGGVVGFIGHHLDQKRLRAPLYRHPADDIFINMADVAQPRVLGKMA